MTKRSPGRPAAIGTVVFIVAAVVCSAVAGLLLSHLLQGEYSQEPLQPLVVAARKVPAGEPIQRDDVRVAHWPRSSIPQGAFSSPDQVVRSSRVPLIPLVAGEALLRSHLSEARSGLGISSLVESGKRAMTIRIDDSLMHSRLIYPGARVDLLCTIRNDFGTDRGPRVRTQIVLQNIKVLAVVDDIDPVTISRRRRTRLARAEDQDSPFAESQSDVRRERSVITLLVSPEESARLALAIRDGKIDIALRNPKDVAAVAAHVATRDIFEPRAAAEHPGSADVNRNIKNLANERAVRRAEGERRRRPRRVKARRYARRAVLKETPFVRIHRGGVSQ